MAQFRLEMLAVWSNDGKFEALKEMDKMLIEECEDDDDDEEEDLE
jgi:hypothetical protein